MSVSVFVCLEELIIKEGKRGGKVVKYKTDKLWHHKCREVRVEFGLFKASTYLHINRQ